MKVKVIDTIDQLKSYKEEWNRILKKSNNKIPFLTLDWIICWWDYFGTDKELFILLISEDEKIYGFCPLMISKKRFYKEISFIGYPKASNMDMLIDNHYNSIAEVVIKYLNDLKGVFIINLHGILNSSLNYDQLIEVLKRINTKHLITSTVSPFIPTDNCSFKKYYSSRFSGRTRRTLRRKEKRLGDLGYLTYEKLRPKDINHIFYLHEKRWEKKIDTSDFSNGKVKDFFKRLVLDKNINIKVVVDTLKLNDKIIAFCYGFECNGRYLFYRISHDDDFYQYSPGQVLLKYKIEECFDNSISTFDFNIGDEPYKSDWTIHKDYVKKIIMPTSNALSRLLYRFLFLKESTKHRLKKNRSIVNFKRNTLGKVKYYISLINKTKNSS